jgi:hypothetical protein
MTAPNGSNGHHVPRGGLFGLPTEQALVWMFRGFVTVCSLLAAVGTWSGKRLLDGIDADLAELRAGVLAISSELKRVDTTGIRLEERVRAHAEVLSIHERRLTTLEEVARRVGRRGDP